MRDDDPAAGPGTVVPHDAAGVIAFDGTCVLCNAWVDFLIARDRAARYRFAAMQAPAGRRLAQAHGQDPDDPGSLLLLDGDGAHLKSEAILRVLDGVGGVWRAAAALGRLVPRAWRDRLYRAIARRRYRWFGHRDLRRPDAAERHRFLVD